jgi:putative DNA primase/helicase
MTHVVHTFPSIFERKGVLDKGPHCSAPWQKPWEPGTSFLPYNPANGTRYKGINVVNLLSRGYGDARWMTDRRAQTKGYQVRRGEKASQIQCWRFDEERKIKDSNGEIANENRERMKRFFAR